MSYQVLARKWRPRSFKELVGQSHVLQALVNALDQDRLHHAYLFTGTRGVGKTTIARIFAKCLNCDTGVSSTPCGQCVSCQEIDDGRFVDLIEVDAASRTKVEDTRELLDNVQYAPTRGRFKVYLIDEVHMLSAHSFNALLKTLEEPPPHVKFLLATTDPQKLPITILSRCLQFGLKNMTPERIVDHLENILGQERLNFETPALWQLARSADGSMRDALSLTDQAIAFGNGRVTESEVSAMLGTIDQGQVMKMVRALSTGNAAEVLAAAERLAEHSPDYLSVLDDMLAVLHRVAIAQAVPDAVDNSQGDREQVLNLAAGMTAENVQLYYQVGLIGKKDLPLAPEPRSGFEMAMLRMLAFRPEAAPASTSTLKAVRESAPAPEVSSEMPAGNSEPEPEPAAYAEPEVINNSEPEPEPVVEEEIIAADIVQPESVDADPVVAKPEQIAEPAASMVDAFEPPAAVSAVAETPAIQPAPVPVAVPVPDNSAPPPHHEEVPLAAYDQVMEAMPMPEPEAVATVDVPSPAPMGQVYEAMASENPAPEPEPEVITPPAALTPVRRIPEMPPVEKRVKFDDLDVQTWIKVFRGLSIGGVTGTLGSHCEFLGCDNLSIQLRLDAGRSTLYNDSHRQRIEKALCDYFEQSLQVAVDVGETNAETPAEWRESKISERLQQAKDSIYSDANVQSLIDGFSAQVLDDSIQPIGNIIR